jgi:hypothetical protein
MSFEPVPAHQLKMISMLGDYPDMPELEGKNVVLVRYEAHEHLSKLHAISNGSAINIGKHSCGEVARVAR